MKSVRAVRQALTRGNADPNEYVALPTNSVPWILSAPSLELPANAYRSNSGDPTTVFLHPVHLAAAVSSPGVVAELLRGGAFAGAVDRLGRHSLHMLLESSELRQCMSEECMSRDAEVAQLLIQRSSDRPSKVEAQIATLLCDAGLDLDRLDVIGRGCTDQITEWTLIGKWIMSTKFEDPSYTISPGTRPAGIVEVGTESPFNYPVPISRPLASSNPAMRREAVLKRIPHLLLDVVILQQGRSRLEVLAPIVGLDIGTTSCSGTGFSPKQAIRLRPPRILPSTPQPSYYQPMSSVQSGAALVKPSDEQQKNLLTALSRNSRTSGHSISSSLRIRTPATGERCSRSWTRRSSGTPYLSYLPVTEALCQLGPGLWDTSSRVTLYPPSSPGITRLSISRPQIIGPTSTRWSAEKLRVSDGEPNNSAAELEGRHHYQSKQTDLPDDYLSTFFRIATKHRYHQALVGVWEFLGAEVFPGGPDLITAILKEPLDVASPGSTCS